MLLVDRTLLHETGAAWGNLIPTSRTDPLVGTTLFEHDAFWTG